MSYRDAERNILGLMKETGSHLSMSQRGLLRAASLADEATIVHATGFLNVHRDVKKHPAPFELPHPWNTDPNADVTPAMRAELETRLDAVSAFPTQH